MVIKEGKFLGVKHCFGTNRWNLPGGGVKKGESYKAAAIRELHEELGITVQPRDVYELVGVKTYQESGHFLRYAIYVVTLQSDVPTHHNHEICEVAWLSLGDTGYTQHVAHAVQQAAGQLHLLK